MEGSMADFHQRNQNRSDVNDAKEGPGGEERENFDTKQETNSNKAAGGNDAAAADGAHQLEADGGMRERERAL